MAYRLEGDGTRTYLCEDHLPGDGDEDKSAYKPKLRPEPPKTDWAPK